MISANNWIEIDEHDCARKKAKRLGQTLDWRSSRMASTTLETHVSEQDRIDLNPC
jgi:hypothetical protein